MIEAIHSGGQTGADSGGLAAAVSLGLRTGGWAPGGYRTEKGPNHVLATLGLREHPSSSYPPRTKLNVTETDGTFWFGRPSSPGGKLTLRLVSELGKPCLVHPWQGGDLEPSAYEIGRFQAWVRENDVRVLNVAGNREEKNPGITRAVYAFLTVALAL